MLVEVAIPEQRFPAPQSGPRRGRVHRRPGARRARPARGGRCAAFSVTLLDGVTGSGKTEVYFEAVARTLEQGRQALIMLPEIALTSQFMDRFTARFGCAPVEWHSALSSPERGRAWRAAATGRGARRRRRPLGAVPALHATSASSSSTKSTTAASSRRTASTTRRRDMAVVRASLGKFPVVLASATPSIESHVNARTGRYRSVDAARAATPASSCPRSPPSIMRQRPAREAATGSRRALVDGHDGDARQEAAIAAVPQPPRLCAADALPLLRPPLRVPAVHGLAGRAPLPQPPQLPPLRLLAAAARRSAPSAANADSARRLRARRRAHRRGGGRALSRGARWRCSPPTSSPALTEMREIIKTHRGRRGRHHHRHADRGQGPPLPAARDRRRRRWRPRARHRPTRARPSARSSSCTR